MNNTLFLCAGEDASNLNNINFALGLTTSLPSYIRPYYIAENDTSQYYGTIDSIYKAINQRGHAVVWLLGLGDDPYIGGSDWITIEDLNGFTNQDKYFFTFSSGRQSAILDTNTNLTKAMMTLQDAGSLGGCVFVGYTYFSIGRLFQSNWAARIFDPSFQSISEVSTLNSLFPPVGIYDYMLKITNLWADPSLKLKYDTTVDVEKINNETPHSFTLYQNYPNPFNPTTTIKFALPADSRVKINIYNSLGQLVETLVDKEMESGYHEINFDASRLSSGVYLYHLQSQDFVSVKKMLLIK
jgi:hypothetical protein